MRSGENPIRRACAEADRLTRAAGARLRQGRIASPAPFRLAGAAGCPPEALAETLAETLSLEGTPFDQVEAEGGYLNFTLSGVWFRGLTETWADISYPVARLERTAAPEGSPGRVNLFDQRFLALLGEGGGAARAARRDSGNLGWLVRYTARRLERFAAPVAVPAVREGDRAVLLAAASLPGLTGRQLARGLVTLAAQVWEASPQRLSPAAAEAARRAILWGIASFTNCSPKPGELCYNENK